MADLSELLKTRATLRQQRDRLGVVKTALLDLEARLVSCISHRDFLTASGGAELALFNAKVTLLQQQKEPLTQEAQALEIEIGTLQSTHDELTTAEPALWGKTAKAPVALFPVRIETRFAEPRRPGGVDLLVRVYPDDVHIEATKKSAEGSRVRLLPHHWNVFVFSQGELVLQESGKPIAKNLPGSLTTRESNGPDDVRAWLVDFEVAVNVGMALRIHFDDANPVIEQLFVLGFGQEKNVRVSASQIASVFEAHAARSALGFLPIGAQTNNTSKGPAAWSAQIAAPDIRSQQKRFKPKSRQNAALTARAFGINGRNSFAAAVDALADSDTPIATVMEGLHPALTDWWSWNVLTVRKFENGSSSADSVTMPPELSAQLRDYAAAYVRSRGPLPPLRIGRQPYGVLPVSSLHLWNSADDMERVVLQPLRDLRVIWEAGLLNVPRKTGDTDQDDAIVNLLARRPLSNDVVVRPVVDLQTPYETIEPFVLSPTARWDAEINMHRLSDATESLPEHLPLVGDASALARRFKDKAALIRANLTPDGVKNMRSVYWATYMGGAAVPASENDVPDEIRATMRGTTNLFNSLVRKGFYLEQGYVFEDTGDISIPANAQRLDAVIIRLYTRLAERLEILATVPPEQYQRLLLETLDVYSHRFDAWLTSLATRRLDKMRTGASASGCHIGGYGWVENLKRDPPQEGPSPRIAGFNRVKVDPTHTYVLAPSLHHATTGAVLRAGFESHSDPEAFAVRLTSRRARVARWMLEGVRNGQSLGALLGYRFERGLHDRELDARIDDFRALFPLPRVAEHDADSPDSAHEAIAAQNVVDGLALHKGVATVSPALKAGIEDLLADLADAIDAVGDLLLAESVHQLVGGNPLRAGLAADTLGRGESVPDRFDVLRTPQSAQTITCRVALMLPAGSTTTQRGWLRDRPRARLSPELDCWVSHLLGDPAKWTFTFEIRNAEGRARQVSCSLADLDICPLDVVFESSGSSASADSLLRLRLIDHVRASNPDAEVRFVPAKPGLESWDTLAALAGRVRAALATASPVMPEDLGPTDAPADALMVATALAARASTFLRDLRQSMQKLQRALRSVDSARGDSNRARAVDRLMPFMLELASFGMQGMYPIAGTQANGASASVAEQARMVLASIEALKLPAKISAPPASADNMARRGWFEQTAKTLRTVVGDAFPIVPAIRVTTDSELAKSLAPAAQPEGGEHATAMAWLGRMGLMQTAVRNLHDALVTAETLGVADEPSLIVTQAPVAEVREPWVALPFDERRRPKAQRTLVIHAPLPLSIRGEGKDVCGLVIDRWVEHLPGLDALSGADRAHGQSEVAGLSFRYDQPDAQAPQAILLAVPPDPKRPWTEDTLLQIVRETLDMAKLRAVELRDLPRMTNLVPSSYVGFDTRSLEPFQVNYQMTNADGTVSTGSYMLTPNEIDEWNSELPL